jgi:UDP-3-O-[3-hydroxymyristoyl] glucosamine N-acyltransferase
MKIFIADILRNIQYDSFIGDENTQISELIMSDESNSRDDVLMWLNDKNLFRLKKILHGTIICSKVEQTETNKYCNYIVVKNPRAVFKKVLETYFFEEEDNNISNKAVIAEDVVLGKNVGIGDYVVIEKGCIIGNNVKIGHGTIIKTRTIIEDNVSVGNNCTIGDKGLGYEKDENGNWQHIPHIGNVIIHEYVAIHDNVVINKAVMGSTEIGEFTKVDSFSMVAHGVKLGRNCMLCGHCAIAGSTVVGDNCWIAPNSTILNKLKIGNDVFVGIGSVVIKNVSEGKKVFGNPAKEVQL